MKTTIKRVKLAVLFTAFLASTISIAEAKNVTKNDSSNKSGYDLQKGSIKSLQEQGPITDIVNKDNVAKNLKIYPIPATNYLNIEINNDQNGEGYADIYNMTGQKVISDIKLNGSNLTSINVQKLEAGYYFLSIRSEIGIVNKKIVIKHK